MNFLEIDGNNCNVNITGVKDQKVALAIKVISPVLIKVAIKIFLD